MLSIQEIAMSDNYFVRLYNALIGKGYAKEIEKPKEENRGASWNSAGGVKNTFSAQVSMDAFGIHGYTHAGVKRLSQDLSVLPLRLIKGYGEKAIELMDHPVLDLLRQPSTDIDEFLFREQITIDITLSGNCYILLLGGDKPVSMVRLHPEEVRIVTDPKQGLIGYEHNSSGSVVMYPPDRIIHGKNAGYQKGPQALYGTGAIQPLARELDADLNSQKLVSEATQKGRPDVLLSPKEDGDIWNKEVRRQILDQYSGMQKAGGAMVLSGQVNVDLLQLSPRDMEFQASRTFARESISAVLGIPPSILGLPTANYALGRSQAVEYWSNQVKRGKRIALLFTRIARLWESDLHFEHDYSEVEALQSVRNDKLMRIEKHIFIGGVSPEVAYAYEGMEYPRAKQEAQDIGEEEDENVRIMKYLDVISQTIEPETKLFTAEYLDIEVVAVPSNPKVQEEQEILKSILGTPPNWNDYKQSHLFFNSNQDQMKEGYYIRIGRRLNTDDILNSAPETGRIAIFKDLLDLAVDHLNGRYGRPPITEEERRSAYAIITKYFEQLQMEPPALLDSYLSFDVKKKDKEITNFPTRGDDKKVSLRNSQYKTFDINYAQKLKANYPEIWRAGGNIRGNEQYSKLLPIAKNNGVANGLSDERAIRKREAWIARHLKDGSQFSDPKHPINLSTIGGIVAQIKWLAIGSIGVTKMKKVLNEMKKKINAEKKQFKKEQIEEQKRVDIWNNWIKTYQKPTEKDLLKATKKYLDGAITRYANRIKKAGITKSNDSIIDPSSLEGKAEERKILQMIVGDIWIERWMKTAKSEGDKVFGMIGKKPPFDFVFGNRDYAQFKQTNNKQHIK
jgi:HK97 family phage portal protein